MGLGRILNASSKYTEPKRWVLGVGCKTDEKELEEANRPPSGANPLPPTFAGLFRFIPGARSNFYNKRTTSDIDLGLAPKSVSGGTAFDSVEKILTHISKYTEPKPGV